MAGVEWPCKTASQRAGQRQVNGRVVAPAQRMRHRITKKPVCVPSTGRGPGVPRAVLSTRRDGAVEPFEARLGVRAEIRRDGHYSTPAGVLTFGARVGLSHSAPAANRAAVLAGAAGARPPVSDRRRRTGRGVRQAPAATTPGGPRSGSTITCSPRTPPRSPLATRIPTSTDPLRRVPLSGGNRARRPPQRRPYRPGQPRSCRRRRRPARFDLPAAVDLLPLLRCRASSDPPDRVLEVTRTLLHPGVCPTVPDRQLRWHAVRRHTMPLVIGGVRTHPAAPFHGWYLNTEIVARNLARTPPLRPVPVIAELLA